MYDAISRAAAAALPVAAMAPLVIFMVTMSLPANAASATFVVNRTGDAPGPCGTTCNLRQAIEAANATPDRDTIHFNIPACGTKTIPIVNGSLIITRPIIIDATTQPQCSTPIRGDRQSLIELRGQGVNVFANVPPQNNPDIDGLVLRPGSDGSSIHGLTINGFSGGGISVNSSNNFIIDNKLGTDPTGNLAKPNEVGVLVLAQATGNDIANNIISGNQASGIEIFGSANAVFENLIGTAVDGRTALPNANNGIVISNHFGPSNQNEIGLSAAQGNTIAFNGAFGIEMDGASFGNEVIGNSIFSNDSGGILLQGGNHNQVAPVITSVSRAARGSPTSPTTLILFTTIRGTLAGAAAGGFNVDLYINDAACDNPSTVQGQEFLMTASVGTDGKFSAVTTLSTRSSITAIARSSLGDSSAFSACKATP